MLGHNHLQARTVSNMPTGKAKSTLMAIVARIAMMVVASLLLFPGSAIAASHVYNVTTPADPDNGMGDCGTTDQSCSLREALNTANANPTTDTSTINLPAGSYANTQMSAFPITGNVTLVGAGSATTTINGSALSRVIDINASGIDVSISGVTITGGVQPATGSVTEGGGIRAIGFHSLTLDGIAVIGNRIVLTSPSQDSVGGGIAVEISAGSLTVENSLIANNVAASLGGGFYASGPNQSVAVINSTVTGNQITGGALGALGGGIYADGSAAGIHITLYSSTVAANSIPATSSGSSGAHGGNIYVFNNASMTLQHSIVAQGVGPAGSENCSHTASGGLGSSGYNIEDRDQCGLTGLGDKVNTDPMLAPLPANPSAASTLALLPNSPAINAGNPLGCTGPGGAPITRDQRGASRPQGARCDIGAFEFLVPGFAGAVSVSGSARVGQTLSCATPAVISPDGPATSALAWLLDGAPIPGASAATYKVASADAGHTLSCRFTAADAAGSANSTSAGLAVPGPAPGSAPTIKLLARTAKISLRTGKGTIRAACTAPSGQRCALAGTLRTRSKRSTRIGRASGSIAAGRTGRLSLRLTGRGRGLLKHKHRLRVRLAGTVSDPAGKHSTLNATIVLVAKRR
jgi:CSLREA domain-containing protein